jgi:Flp pilus assembly pilin Flp
MNSVRLFLRDEDGAITVDWVVLTAALIGVVMAIFVVLTPAVYEDAAQRIREDVDTAAER